MKNHFKSPAILVLSLCTVVFLISVASGTRQEQWDVPDSYKKMKNPVVADSASLSNGQSLYKKNCLSCHGKTGLGNGVKARTLQTFPGDLTSDEYQSETDGEHFYKSKFGKDEMPSYEKVLTDTEIWEIVNYMRTFKE
jgi:mono/diheme cytochrome c family protein